MQQQNSGMSCQLGSWAMAAGAGLLITVLLLIMSDTSFLGAVFLGGVAFAILGLLFSWLFCRELPPARGFDLLGHHARRIVGLWFCFP